MSTGTVLTRTIAPSGSLPNVSALANTATTGLYTITGSGTSATLTITSGDSVISIANGNGVTGNPTITVNQSALNLTNISGTLGVIQGGTGLTSLGTANQVIGTNVNGTGLEYKSIVAGSNVTIVNQSGTITISSGGGGGSLLLYAENPQSGYVSPAATGINAVGIGYGAIANSAKSLALGEQSFTRITGGIVHANGRFASSGDAQAGRYIIRAISGGATPVQGFIDGSGGSIGLVLADNSTWTFRLLVTAQRSDVSNGRAGFELKGVIYRINGPSSINIQGVVSSETFSASNPWSVAAVADTLNGALKVTFTGEAGKTIRWVALVETIEVTD
jgi:hypothetical protein